MNRIYRLILLALMLLLNFQVTASSLNLRVMSFNTTCAWCNKGKFDSFKDRRHWIVDTVKRNNPDIISMQEVMTSRQLKWIVKELKDYDLYYGNYRVFKFTDSALLIRKNRFSVTSHGGFWLGRKGGDKFSLGWKLALPRRVQWASLWDNQTKQEFKFVGSHFDNRDINKNNSAQFVVDTFGNDYLPVIFAADTNLKPGSFGFETLSNFFIDSFEVKDNFVMVRNSDTSLNDGCNLEKGDVFPACRVDHIMLSNGDSWRVLNWGVDQYKYGKKHRFTSDHRAIFADL